MARNRPAFSPTFAGADRSVLVRYARDLPRLLPLASDEEKRVLLRGFVSAAELEPERREVNLDLQTPPDRVNNVKAAARIGVLWIGRCAWCG